MVVVAAEAVRHGKMAVGQLLINEQTPHLQQVPIHLHGLAAAGIGVIDGQQAVDIVIFPSQQQAVGLNQFPGVAVTTGGQRTQQQHTRQQEYI